MTTDVRRKHKMANIIDIFEELGLAKNEARVYDALLVEGESGVGDIAVKSKVHRRNVYDTLNKLIERGLVFERITSTEHRYQAAEPNKLMELVKEKEEKVQSVMPDLTKLYNAVPHNDDVIVYRGIEGWKNYLRNIIQVGEDVYTIGAKGTWQDDRLKHVVSQLARASKDKDIRNYWLFDHGVKGTHEPYIEQGFQVEYRYLPPGFDSPAAVDVFGDHVVIVTDPTPDRVVEEFSVTVLVNQHTADAFRTWHALLWKMCAGKSKKQPATN